MVSEEQVWNNLKCQKRCAFECMKSLKMGFCEEQKMSEIRLKSELSHPCIECWQKCGKFGHISGKMWALRFCLWKYNKTVTPSPSPAERFWQGGRFGGVIRVSGKNCQKYCAPKVNRSQTSMNRILCGLSRRLLIRRPTSYHFFFFFFFFFFTGKALLQKFDFSTRLKKDEWGMWPGNVFMRKELLDYGKGFVFISR